METVKRQNLSEVIASRIKNFIVANQLKPGDRLPTEHEMAARFGVSRVSVREATKALGFLGVLKAAPRRGLTVGEFDLQRATEQLGFPLVLTDHPKSQLLQTRIIIETGALPHVAAKMAENPALYQQLANLTDPSKEGDTLDEQIATDLAFHRALLAASDLGPLVAFNDLLQVFFNRFREALDPPNIDKKVRGHLDIIDALRRGDVTDACGALRRHLEYFEAYL
ncbi:MAG TPA: GntR family transcriptional regulator [Pirellulales bacterium]|jgi:DNA-binding FadR family transcriptional regulator|nr:GntR family transcriptional regulator [Pirellulales bacterium]